MLDKPIKLAVTITIKDGIASFDFSDSDPQARGPGQPAAVDGRGLRVLFADRQPRPEPAFQRRHARRGAARTSRRAPSSTPSRRRPVSNYQMVNLMLVDVILEALAHFNPAARIANSGSSSALTHRLDARAGRARSTMQYEIMGSAYGGGSGHDGATGDRDASEQPAHHADRDPGIRVSLPHHALRPRARLRRRRANGAAA